MARIYDYNKNEWVTVNTASDIAIRDLSESFGGAVNVEEALQHVAKDITEGQNDIADCKKSLEEHSEWIDWLKVNGGGGGGGGTGGGSSAPIISSTLTESSFIVDKGTSVILPIYFQSPNLGDGVLIVAIDGVEVDSFSIKQGNNNVNIGELPNLSNRVSVYAKDRTGKLSNQLDWTIICGGIDLTLDFDYNVDYTVGSTIYMPFNIYSPTDEPVVLNLDIAGEKRQMQCNQGYNEYVFRDLGVGVHTITIQATDGTYNSQAITFNIVIVDSDSLYLSTTFENGCEIELGLPIVIDYRISNPSDEYMTVNQYLDGELYKTLSAKRGAYSWTLNGLNTTKEYTYKIEVIASNGTREVEGTFNVVKGAYTPVQVNTQGLAYRLYAGDRTNQDLDKQNPVYEGISATLHDFNFSSNGWVDGVLKCNGGSYVEIDYSPWSDNAPNGCTIEIDFKATNVGDLDSRVLEYKDSGTNKGIFIGVEEAKINSISNEGKVFVNANEWTTMSFVIDRKTKFAKIFINGVCTRAFKLSDSGSGVSAILEDFAFRGKMYLNCSKDLTNRGVCDIKDLRVYRRPLTDDEIVKNVIAQETDLQKQKELYDFNFNNTSLPVMRMYGDTSNMTLETPVSMRIKYSSPNTEKYGQPFDLPYCQVNWQGTSSLDYVLKNYNIVLKDANMADAYYSPYPNGVPENIFCLKADYMESSHSRNVGITKFVEACLYSTKNPAQVKNPNVRNSVEGFPILLYINDELQGVYNFNTDRRSTNTFGYTDENNHLVYEISANSDTTAGAFIKWSADTGKSEIDYYKSDFSCIYPPTRVAGNDNFAEIKRLVEWVDNASDEDFRDNLDQYFNREYLIRYYIFVMIFGAVDSLGKNMKLASWDGRIWYPQVYDCDTTIGLDNTGFLKFDSDIEIGDEGVFNTTSSKLWSKVKLLLDDEIKAQYSLIRQNKFTLDNLFKYIVEEQMNKIPATFYNKDMQTKYLNWGSSYLYALHGRGKQQIKTWLTERLLYIDTLMRYDVSTSDYVTIRSSKLGEVYLDIETFNSMYLNVKWRNTVDNSSSQRLKVKKGEKVRFSFNMPTATDQEIRVYGGKYIKSLGDLSNLQPTTLLLAKAPGITELTCHSTNLINTDLSECTNLKRVDLSGCTQLGSGVGAQSIVDVSKCTNIEYVNCQNTQITSVKLNALGSNIKEIWYPTSIQEIALSECPNLKIVGLQIGHNCKSLRLVNCPNIEAFGNIEYNVSTKKVSACNGDFLSGVQDLYLDNSFVKEATIDLSNSVELASITVKNLPLLEDIRLGCNTRPSSLLVDYRNSDNNLSISKFNCPKFKSLYFTSLGRKSFCWERLNRYTNWNVANDCDPLFLSKSSTYYNWKDSTVFYNIDLSDCDGLENLYMYNIMKVANLILPPSLKNFIADVLIDAKCFPNNAEYKSYLEGTVTAFDATKDGGFSAYQGGIGSGNIIDNIWCSTNSETVSDITWDFKGLKLQDFTIKNLNAGGAIDEEKIRGRDDYNSSYDLYADYKVKVKNLNYQPINECNDFSVYAYESLENVTVDLSKFIGSRVIGALARLNEINNSTFILPNDYSNVEYVNKFMYNLNTTNIGWNDEIVKLYFSKCNIISDFKNVTLREQTKDEERPSFTNSKYTSGSGYASQPFKGCNLKYIDEFNLPNATSMVRMFDNRSNDKLILEINSINAPNCTNIEELINQNGVTERVGLINIGQNIYGKTAFNRASKLKSVTFNEDVTFRNVESMFAYSGIEGEQVFTVTSECTSLNAMFRDSVGLTRIEIKGDISNLTNMANFARGCTNVSELILPIEYDGLPSTLADSSGAFAGTGITRPYLPTRLDQNCKGSEMFKGCKNLTSPPIMPEGYTELGAYIADCNFNGHIVIKLPDSCTHASKLTGFGKDLASVTLHVGRNLKYLDNFIEGHTETENRVTLKYIRFVMDNEGTAFSFDWFLNYKICPVYGLSLSRLSQTTAWGAWGAPELLELKGRLENYTSNEINLSGYNAVQVVGDMLHYVFNNLGTPKTSNGKSTIKLRKSQINLLSDEQKSNATSLGWTISSVD